MANERLIFLACNIYSILAEYSLHSCTFRWALWPIGLWSLNYHQIPFLSVLLPANTFLADSMKLNEVWQTKHTLLRSGVPQDQNLDFLCSLFPNIVCVPLFLWIYVLVPLFPEPPWDGICHIYGVCKCHRREKRKLEHRTYRIPCEHFQLSYTKAHVLSLTVSPLLN